MNLKGKVKNYGFWISLASAVLLAVQLIGIKIDVPYVMEVVNSILAIAVVLGIISDPTNGKGFLDKK